VIYSINRWALRNLQENNTFNLKNSHYSLELEQPKKYDTEKMYNAVGNIFDKLNNRFIKYEEENDTSESTLSYLTKLASSLGYMSQVHGGLAKAYQHEKRLADVEKKLAKIPSEIVQQYLHSGR